MFNLDGHTLVSFMETLSSSDLLKRTMRLPLMDSGLSWTRRILEVLKSVVEFMKFHAEQTDNGQLQKNLGRLMTKTIDPKVRAGISMGRPRQNRTTTYIYIYIYIHIILLTCAFECTSQQVHRFVAITFIRKHGFCYFRKAVDISLSYTVRLKFS